MKRDELLINKDIINYVLISLIITVVIVFGIMMYYYTKQSSEKILPSRCPVVKGLFGLVSGKIGSPLSICGNQSSSSCVFNNITSLTNAVNLCLSYPTLCNAFSYSASTNTVYFISPTSVLNNSNIFDTYVLQNNVTLTV